VIYTIVAYGLEPVGDCLTKSTYKGGLCLRLGRRGCGVKQRLGLEGSVCLWGETKGACGFVSDAQINKETKT